MPPARYVDVERCVPNLIEETIINEKSYYSGYCRCHTYRVGDEIKRISESENKPLTYCDKQMGFKDYATTLYPFLEEWRVYLLQQEKK